MVTEYIPRSRFHVAGGWVLLARFLSVWKRKEIRRDQLIYPSLRAECCTLYFQYRWDVYKRQHVELECHVAVTRTALQIPAEQ